MARRASPRHDLAFASIRRRSDYLDSKCNLSEHLVVASVLALARLEEEHLLGLPDYGRHGALQPEAWLWHFEAGQCDVRFKVVSAFTADRQPRRHSSTKMKECRGRRQHCRD